MVVGDWAVKKIPGLGTKKIAIYTNSTKTVDRNAAGSLGGNRRQGGWENSEPGYQKLCLATNQKKRQGTFWLDKKVFLKKKKIGSRYAYELDL